MKALVLTKNNFEVREIKGELEDLQNIVGGYIEIPYLSKVFHDNGIDTIINEEGKFIEDCKPSIAIIDCITRQIVDVVHGNCIFVSHDDEGETIELTEEQIAVVLEELEMDIALAYNDGNKYITRALFI